MPSGFPASLMYKVSGCRLPGFFVGGEGFQGIEGLWVLGLRFRAGGLKGLRTLVVLGCRIQGFRA